MRSRRQSQTYVLRCESQTYVLRCESKRLCWDRSPNTSAQRMCFFVQAHGVQMLIRTSALKRNSEDTSSSKSLNTHAQTKLQSLCSLKRTSKRTQTRLTQPLWRVRTQDYESEWWDTPTSYFILGRRRLPHGRKQNWICIHIFSYIVLRFCEWEMLCSPSKIAKTTDTHTNVYFAKKKNKSSIQVSAHPVHVFCCTRVHNSRLISIFPDSSTRVPNQSVF